MVDDDGRFSLGVVNGNGDVFGAIGACAVSDQNLIVPSFPKSGGELDFLFSFVGIFVVEVALADPRFV